MDEQGHFDEDLVKKLFEQGAILFVVSIFSFGDFSMLGDAFLMAMFINLAAAVATKFDESIFLWRRSLIIKIIDFGMGKMNATKGKWVLEL